MSFFSTLINIAQKSTELSKKVEKHMQKEQPSIANPKTAKQSSGKMSSAEKDLYDNNVFGYFNIYSDI